jgi:SAM-dependent methyltransferase
MSQTPGGGPPARRSLGFEQAYQGRPPWDIGRPQPEVVRLADDGEMVGSVLDVGCGTGENALELARRGLDVLGVDAAPTAIRRARDKAEARGSQARFEVADALELSSLGREFDSVLDCGLFHVFDDDDRRRYVASLRDAIRAGGRFFVLVFSDLEPADWGGPRRISAPELRNAFRQGWTMEFLRASRFATTDPEVAGHAWCGRIRRDAA